MDLSGWANFFSAEVGASAALAGLVMVAISINLSSILKHPNLPGRAFETLAMLVGVLLVASVGLVPDQTASTLGIEIFIIGVAVWFVCVIAQVRMLGIPVPGKKWAPLLRVVLGQAATLPFVIAGVMLELHGASGIYWVVPGVIFCLIAGVLNSWVLLVEVVR
jgi:hypothetical protein